MARIIDSTLALIDKYEPTKKQILKFCELMKSVGIIDLEISLNTYKTIKTLPEGFRFYLAPQFKEEVILLDAYKMIKWHSEEEGVISQLQINDIREIVQLRKHSKCQYIRVVGLDDLLCHNYLYVFKEIKQTFIHSRINFCPENSYYCATALAVEWILSGGDEVTTSLAGIGNRAATEEVMMALRVNKRYKPSQCMKGFIELKALLEEITSILISPTKPVLGEDIFLVESGIHVDGILKKAANYLPYPPESIGREVKIVIGKHSGSSSISIKLKEYGIDIKDKSVLNELLQKVKRASIKQHRSLEDEEFLTLAKEVIGGEREKMDC